MMDPIASKRNLKLIFGAVGLLYLTACAHVRPSSELDSPSGAQGPKSLSEVLSQDLDTNGTPAGTGEIFVFGKKLKNSRYDIPITVNSRVEYWIDYFCNRGRPFFEKYLERSKYFIPYIAPLLKQNGMPEDLVYLAMIESGFNNLARSRAKAVGPWQFISATGRRYGLMVNWWVDERRDIRKSTLAAVGYLRDLYNIFQSWELAAAAYNAGEAKIARGLKRYGTKDFWVLAQHSFLRQETRDYVPKIIAAALIAKNRSQFGFQEEDTKAAPDEAVAGDGELVKVIKSDHPDADPQYKEEKAEDEEKGIDVAQESQDGEADADQKKDTVKEINLAVIEKPSAPKDILPAPLAKPVPTPHVTKSGEVGGEELAEFEVQSPADLMKIAKAASLSYQTVKSLNPEVLRWCTPPHLSTYRLKLPVSVKESFLATYNHQAFPRKVQFLSYKVRKGETLSKIARHFGIKVDPISDLNRVSPQAYLVKGTQVLLPLPKDRSRSLASLEVRDPPERHRSRHRFHRRKAGRIYKVSYRHRESAHTVAVRPSSQG